MLLYGSIYGGVVFKTPVQFLCCNRNKIWYINITKKDIKNN